MIVSSHQRPPGPDSIALRAANAMTLGLGSLVAEAIKSAAEEADDESRQQLKEMRLSDALREFLDEQFSKHLGGSVEHLPVDSEIGAQVQLQYTVARAPGREIVLLQVPAAILQDGDEVRRLHMVNYVLRGKTVRIFAPDLEEDVTPAFNGIRRVWRQDDIDAEFVPVAHLRKLEEGTADLENVLQLFPAAAPPAARSDDVAAPPEPASARSAVRFIKIFLASSSELRNDRDEFDRYFRERNDRLLEEGLYLKIIRWENFLDAMSETRLQDEYNVAVAECDVFVSLFFTKAGKFTEEEFDTAHRQFEETGKPLIYAFFKDAPVKTGEIGDEILTLLNFKKKLRELGHYETNYEGIEHLKLQFSDQLPRLREKLS